VADILKMVQNNPAPLAGVEAKKKIAQFSREQADAIENDEPDHAEKLVIIVNATPPGPRTSSGFTPGSATCPAWLNASAWSKMAAADICDAG
jgi:hypothetical protein